MRAFIVSLLLVLLTLAKFSCPEKKVPLAEEIIRLDKAATEFSYRGNANGLADMLTDDFVAVSSRGAVVTKKALIERMEPRKLVYKRLDVKERQVRVYGDAAVVVGLADVDFFNNSNVYDGAYRYMRIYVRQNGVWKICSQQMGRIPEDGAALAHR